MTRTVYVGIRNGLIQQGVEEYLKSQAMKCVLHKHYQKDMLIDICVIDDVHEIEKFSCARIPSVLCADFSRRTDVITAFQQGAIACISIWGSFEHLLLAIESACTRRKYICPTLSELMCRSIERIRQTDLTQRESVVVSLIAEGYSSKQIGRKLGISPHTVDTHRRSSMKKIGSRKVAQLTRYAISREGIEQ